MSFYLTQRVVETRRAELVEQADRARLARAARRARPPGRLRRSARLLVAAITRGDQHLPPPSTTARPGVD